MCNPGLRWVPRTVKTHPPAHPPSDERVVRSVVAPEGLGVPKRSGNRPLGLKKGEVEDPVEPPRLPTGVDTLPDFSRTESWS